MKKWVQILKMYRIGDALVLIWALILDSFYKYIPRHVFLVKNTYDFVLANGGTFSRNDDEVEIKLNGLTCILRLKGSDFMVFDQLIVERGIQRVIEIAKRLNKKDLIIFDCGANIGFATLLFKSEFPFSRIVSIEPESKNYLQLQKNIQSNSFQGITPLNCGVWYEKSQLKLDFNFRDKSDWSYALTQSLNDIENTIEVDSIQGIANQIGLSQIDILKIDIEGSEYPIFRNLNSWRKILETVKIISIEPHEEHGKSTELVDILKKSGFSIEYYQELIIGYKV